MKKIIFLKSGTQIVPALSAVILASTLFIIFVSVSNRKNENLGQPIFSNFSLEKFKLDESKVKYNKKKPSYVQGEIIIKYKDEDISLTNSEGKDEAAQIKKTKSLNKIKTNDKMNIELVRITDKSSVSEKIKELEKDDRIEYAEPNYIRYASYSPDDTYYNVQWALNNSGQEIDGVSGTEDADMDVAEMWDSESDHSQDIVVAVIDSGVALNHPDVSANLVSGYDVLTSGVEEPYDTYGHGSHIAGIISSVVNNGTGMSGISRNDNVKVMPIRAGDANGISLYSELLAIDYAIENNADILSLSFGSYEYSEFERDALEAFPGLIVVAAGNEGFDTDSTPAYPSSLDIPNIISVAATDQNDELADFSNYGENSVDVGAPGVSIYSLEGYRAFSEDFESTPDFTQSGTGANWILAVTGDGNSWTMTDGDYLDSGSYSADIDSYLTSGSANIDSSSYSYLSLMYYCELPSNTDPNTDYLGIEIYDGSTWVELERINTEESGIFTSDVTPYVSTDFTVRFHWHTDSSDNTYMGCLIDDVKVIDSSSSQGSYQYMDGTSMACPYVAAVSAMVWGNNPSMSVSQLKSIILDTGDSVNDLSGTTVSGKRVNAYNAYMADPDDYTGEEDPPEDPEVLGARTFHPDRRCHWKKPGDPTWMKLEPITKDGVSGMLLTWTQYDADKVNIKIDDGTGKYPWKIGNTVNDGSEFLANVTNWQNIMIRPINHCKEGEYSLPISYSAYPRGWYGTAALASAGGNAGSGSSSVLAATDASTGTQSGTSSPSAAVPETGSNEILFITLSSLIVASAVYYTTSGKSRSWALKTFEKHSSKNK